MGRTQYDARHDAPANEWYAAARHFRAAKGAVSRCTEAWERFSYYGMTAPVKATMMGVAYLTLFVASNIMGRLGGLYETLSPAMFWGLHAAVAAAGGLAVLAFGSAMTRVLETDSSQP